jgi:N-acetylglucosamine kinase-like BadF-type ATPase
VATVDDDIVLPDNPISLVTDPAALKNFVRQLDARAEARIVQREQARTFGDIQARVQAKMDQNPEEFIKLRPIMFDLSKANPQADIDQLYDAAKNQYTTERKSLVAEIKAELGLTGAESEKLKAIVGRVRQAPISGGTGVQVKPAEKSDKDGAELLKAIANADKY